MNEPDVDEVIAKTATEHGLDPNAMPPIVLKVGVTLLRESMPLLRADTFGHAAHWLPVLAEAYVKWAREIHARDGTLP